MHDYARAYEANARNHTGRYLRWVASWTKRAESD